MPNSLRTFFDHSRHKLVVKRLDAPLDVLAFEGEERLSQLSTYRIEFTSPERDINVEQVLNRDASFSLHAVPQPLPYRGAPIPEIKPLRVIHGVVTGFKRLSGSKDEARYELTLQPRLALLGRGKQFRLYQHQSVPQIVESILRKRHALEGQDFLFHLHREYPRRLQVMQYDESDLAFINRLLAEVGIWYRFTSDERLKIDVVEFHDDQRAYQFGVELPCNPPSGLSSRDQDSVWHLQSSHQVVEQHINIRAYDHLNANAWLDGEVDQTRGTTATTYGEAYHYAEPYTVLGSPIDQDEDLQSESGFFYARLRHERYLNDQTQLSGISSSATLAPGQVLTITGGAPQAFVPRVVIIQLSTRAARDRTFEASFTAIPYSQTVCFRPPLMPKPQIAGTLAARVTSRSKNDIYSEIDMQGHYKVNFLFDRDPWPTGEESRWLRLARPYGGDTHGLHLPLICGTEVAIAFEQGDPDRPYIAHALHDSQHPDPITLSNNDYKRNVLRTPANNKLRMEDERGREHVKLSTDHSGKSQLNLGHVVDAKKKKRGEGFELRTDGHGAIRAGSGLFVSADKQAKASGYQLDMAAAIDQLESALSLARTLASAAHGSHMTPGDTDSQQRLVAALRGLAQPGILLHAPAGIGVLSPKAVCVSSGGESVGIMAAHNTDISAGQNITATAEDGISVFANQADLQLKAGKGKVELHAQDSSLHALAKTDIKIESLNGRVEISAPDELVLNCGGAYIRLKGGDIEVGAPGNLYLKTTHVQKISTASLSTPVTPLLAGYSGSYALKDKTQTPMPFTRYQVTTQQGEVFKGVTDKDGRTMKVHTLLPGALKVELSDSEIYDEQLRLVGPNGELASYLKYSVTLADGSKQEGVTDEQGYTQRFVTPQAIQITHLTLFPPESVESFCCAAQNAQAPMQVDLTASNIMTNQTEAGRSTQVVSLPKGKKRSLTPGEIAMAQTVFKDAVNYNKVNVHHGGWWGFFGFQNTAVTPNGEMYYPESTKYYRDDFSSTDDHRDKALFMHEMTHVWQYQLGYPVKKMGIKVSSQGAKVYEYTLSQRGRFSQYNMEQQGEIVSDYYMICVVGSPRDVWNRRNYNKSSALLALTLDALLNDPKDKKNLPA